MSWWSWFNPVQPIKRILNMNEIKYKNKIFEIHGYYMWKNGQGVSRIESASGATVKHVLFDLKGKWLGEQSNSLHYFYENTNKRVQPKIR